MLIKKTHEYVIGNSFSDFTVTKAATKKEIMDPYITLRSSISALDSALFFLKS